MYKKKIEDFLYANAEKFERLQHANYKLGISENIYIFLEAKSSKYVCSVCHPHPMDCDAEYSEEIDIDVNRLVDEIESYKEENYKRIAKLLNLI